MTDEIANEIAETHKGMMIAIPEPEWRVFVTMTTAELVATLRQLAQNVRLRAFRKHPRGPKKPPVKRQFNPRVSKNAIFRPNSLPGFWTLRISL
jgi:hypothetical protein